MVHWHTSWYTILPYGTCNTWHTITPYSTTSHHLICHHITWNTISPYVHHHTKPHGTPSHHNVYHHTILDTTTPHCIYITWYTITTHDKQSHHTVRHDDHDYVVIQCTLWCDAVQCNVVGVQYDVMMYIVV